MGNEPVGGLFDISSPEYKGVPESWIAYIAVDYVDVRVKKATKAQGDEAGLRRARRRTHRDAARTGRLASVDDAGVVISVTRIEWSAIRDCL